MPNYNTIITAEAGLPCTKEEADAIGERLRAAWEDGEDKFHGFTVSYEDGQSFLEAEESGTPGELPEDVLKQIGALIARAGRPYLEFGCAFTCSRLVPGSHGGTAFRIYPDGSLVDRIEMWPDDPKRATMVEQLRGWAKQLRDAIQSNDEHAMEDTCLKSEATGVIVGMEEVARLVEEGKA